MRKYCGSCKYLKYCEKEFWVSEHTEQQSVLGCLRGEKNVPVVNEDMEEEGGEDQNVPDVNSGEFPW